MRKFGMLGRGNNANSLFAIAYGSLPPEARTTIARIITGGPFHSPGHDGRPFNNNYRDLPSGFYLEFTVPTTGVTNRGKRRIVARRKTGQLFFTACHYERVQIQGGNQAARAAAAPAAAAIAAALDAEWQNGFYVVTGMTADLRNQIKTAIKTLYGAEPA